MTGQRRVQPSGRMLRRIPEITAEPRWGGGLSRADLAAALRVRKDDPVFRLSLLVCRRRRQVDFWRDYVISETWERNNATLATAQDSDDQP